MLAFITASLLALSIMTGGQHLIEGLTDIAQVQHVAVELLNFAAIYILLSVAAFQLDGIFIGATRTAQMRNASIAATGIFLAAWWVLTNRYGIAGLWVSFILYVCARALALLVYFPGLRKSIA